MLLEAVVAQKEGPLDATGTRHGLSAFAPLMQNLLGALSVLCGFTHEEGHTKFELFHVDVEEAESILAVTGVCIQFLTNCHVLPQHQVAMIYISIIWQYVLPGLPTSLPLFSVMKYVFIHDCYSMPYLVASITYVILSFTVYFLYCIHPSSNIFIYLFWLLSFHFLFLSSAVYW